MLIGFAVRLVLGAVSMTYHAAFLLSMVFGYGGLFPLVLWPAEMETMLSKRAAWLWCWCGLLLPNRSLDRLTMSHTC